MIHRNAISVHCPLSWNWKEIIWWNFWNQLDLNRFYHRVVFSLLLISMIFWLVRTFIYIHFVLNFIDRLTIRWILFSFYFEIERKIDLSNEIDQQKDYRFTKWMSKRIGVHAIPPSAFFSDNHKKIMENFVRFCFFKKDENLRRGAEILAKWANK